MRRLLDAISLLRIKKTQESILLLTQLNNQNSEDVDTLYYLNHALDSACQWNDREERINRLKNIFRLQLQKKLPIGNFPLCYLPFETSDLDAALYSALQTKSHKEISQFNINKKKNKKPRIGILSVDYRCHSGGQDLKEKILLLKNKNIDLYGYYSGSSKKTYDEFKNLFPNYKDISKLPKETAARLIYKDNIDILIDTTRNIEPAQIELVKYHPAKIQISAWGYGTSTGSNEFEYFLTDNFLTKQNELKYYSESLLFSNMYHPYITQNKSFDIKPSKNKSKTYASFNAPYKLTPKILSTWMGIINELPNSKLHLGIEDEKTKENLALFFKKNKFIEKKYIFLDKLPKSQHMLRLASYDVILDNPRLGGGGSFLDSLNAGRPSISFHGKNFSSRSSYSIAKTLQIPELIAKDCDQYIKKAIEFATSKHPLHVKKTTFKDNLLEIIFKLIEDIGYDLPN